MSLDKSNSSSEDFIDSVKEVDLNIRDHRCDDDFEQMLAGLNEKIGKKSGDTEKQNASSAHKSLSAEKPDKPVSENGRLSDSAAVPASAVLKPETNNGFSPEINVSETQSSAKSDLNSGSDSASEPELFKNIGSVWKNPGLSGGGRVSMNIKTDFRKEIKVTVPREFAEEAERRRMAELAKKAAERRRSVSQTQNMKTPDDPDSSKQPKQQDTQVFGFSRQNEIPQSEKKQNAVNAGENKVQNQNLSVKKAAEAYKVRRVFALSNAVVCMIIFFGIAFYLIACERESGFIQSENRYLTEKPRLTFSAVLDGSYFTDITRWYTDTVPHREELKSFSSKFSDLFGINISDVKISGTAAIPEKEVFISSDSDSDNSSDSSFEVKNDSQPEKYFDLESETDDESSEEIVEITEDLDDGKWMGSVIVSGSGENVRAMSAFYGTFAMGQKFAETINKYAADLPDVNVYNMTIPISSAYYLPGNLGDSFTSQHDAILNIGSYLDSVYNVDVYDALAAHTSEYIYARTDHHWMPLGAYYATEVFAESAGVDYPALDAYSEYQIEDFVGTMYAYSNYDEELNQNPDTFIYYKPANSYSVSYYDSYFSNERTGGTLFFDYASGVNCYSAILGTDDEIAKITTDCKNDRILVIFKDSFGNAAVPFLTNSFSEIYVCDYRYFDINAIEFCEEVGCTDLLFAVSIGSAHTNSHIDTISNNRIQAKSDDSSSDTESSEE